MEELINLTIQTMWYYQKLNNVKKCCYQNCQYLVDTINKNLGSDLAKAHNCIVLNDTTAITHCVIKYNNKIFDPSYETAKMKNSIYIDKLYKLNSNNVSKELRKTVIYEFLEGVKIANKINNGDLIVVDLKHYNGQSNFVNEKFKNRENITE